MSFSSAVPRRAAWRRGGQGGAGARVIGWLSVAAARDVQYRSRVTPGSVARAPAKAQTDLAVEALAFPVLHGDVAGEGAEQLDVAVGVVEPFPVEVADVDYLEQAARLDLSRLVGQLARAGPGAARRQPFADLVVGVLDLAEERVAAVGKHVEGVPEGEVSAGSERPPCQGVAAGGIDPVPRRCGEDQVEMLPGGRPPVLETSLDNFHAGPVEVPAGERSQVCAELDAGDLEAPAGQGEGGLAGGAADLQETVTWCQPGDGDEVVEQFAGVVGACPLVGPGCLVERLPQPLPVLIGGFHDCCARPSSMVTRTCSANSGR